MPIFLELAEGLSDQAKVFHHGRILPRERRLAVSTIRLEAVFMRPWSNARPRAVRKEAFPQFDVASEINKWKTA
jgi:hypothetical protein